MSRPERSHSVARRSFNGIMLVRIAFLLELVLSASPSPPRPLVIVVGMPKCGTGTIYEFFECNGWKTSHQVCSGFLPWLDLMNADAERGITCAACVTHWVTTVMGKPASDRSAELRLACGNYDVFAQLDSEPLHTCLFPQVSFLQTLLNYLPHACFVLNTRPTDKWLSSVRNWHHLQMGANLTTRLIDSCPIHPRNETGLGDWYERHNLQASLALRSARCALEIDIEDGIGLTTHLDRFFKVNSSRKCLHAKAHRHETKTSSRVQAGSNGAAAAAGAPASPAVAATPADAATPPGDARERRVGRRRRRRRQSR